MPYAGYALAVVMVVTLVLAMGWVLFHLSRVIISIIRDKRAARLTPPKLQQSEFGILRLEDGLWSGTIQRDGKAVNFFVAGAESGPDAMLVERLRDALVHLPERERAALDYIRSHAPALNQREATLQTLVFLLEENPDAFTMEFSLAGDEDGIWRVEFKSGQPISLGRAD